MYPKKLIRAFYRSSVEQSIRQLLSAIWLRAGSILSFATAANVRITSLWGPSTAESVRDVSLPSIITAPGLAIASERGTRSISTHISGSNSYFFQRCCTLRSGWLKKTSRKCSAMSVPSWPSSLCCSCWIWSSFTPTSWQRIWLLGSYYPGARLATCNTGQRTWDLPST